MLKQGQDEKQRLSKSSTKMVLPAILLVGQHRLYGHKLNCRAATHIVFL